MKYQLVYTGKRGSAESIAKSILEILPEGECKLSDMATQPPTPASDTYLFCFEVSRGACPFPVLDFIEQLDGKTLLFIGVSALSTDEDYRVHLENQITPFLPDSCNYKGIHLCKGCMSEEDVTEMQRKATTERGDVDVNRIIEFYKESQNHPDIMDRHSVLQFVNRKLIG